MKIFLIILVFFLGENAFSDRPLHHLASTETLQHINTSAPQHLRSTSPTSWAHPHNLLHTQIIVPDTLPPEKALHQSIDSCYAQRAYLELLEFKNTRKGEWLKFLPNIGISYTLNGQPRPAVSFSSGLLYQARKARLQRLAKQEQIVQSTLSEAEEAKAELATLLLRHSILQEEIVAQHKRHQIEQEIFLIQEDEYNRLERSPAEYLQAKRTFLIQQETLEDLKRRSLLLEMEILQHACFPADTTHFSGAFQK